LVIEFGGPVDLVDIIGSALPVLDDFGGEFELGFDSGELEGTTGKRFMVLLMGVVLGLDVLVNTPLVIAAAVVVIADVFANKRLDITASVLAIDDVATEEFETRTPDSAAVVKVFDRGDPVEVQEDEPAGPQVVSRACLGARNASAQIKVSNGHLSRKGQS
jgi:hypothetical protein